MSQRRHAPPAVRGGLPWLGHMMAYGRHPYRFVERVAADYGEVASFVLMGQRIVLLTGDSASSVFYRAADDQLDQSAAYQVMTPIFGEGVLYDASTERKDQQLAMLIPPLRGEAMQAHVPRIVAEVAEATRGWRHSGEVELVDFMQRLTINTATHCLLGPELRYELNDEFLSLYRDLERGVSPLAYYFPNAPLPKFRRRDAARRRMQQLVDGILSNRAANPVVHDDLVQSLMNLRYSDGTVPNATEIAGVLVGAVFAGHHTSAGTAAWLMIELHRHERTLADVLAEIDRTETTSLESLHHMPALDAALKEVLRLHPPVIILMRKALTDLDVAGYTIAAGDLVWVCPPVTHRMSSLFADPHIFEPDRFGPDRREDRNSMAYQPFGGGKHRCAGSGFATMQIKAIISELLRNFTFELAAPASRYTDDYRQMIVQPRAPSTLRYRAR